MGEGKKELSTKTYSKPPYAQRAGGISLHDGDSDTRTQRVLGASKAKVGGCGERAEQRWVGVGSEQSKGG